MSSEYFGLIMDPFESGPDPRFLHMDPARRNAFAQLLSSVYECRGLVLLSCARGLGKSTLIRHLADQLSALDSVLVLYPGGVLNCRPGMSFDDILAACRGRLDRRQPSAADEARLMTTLERSAGRSQVAVLMLDDADALDDATLVRLRRLCESDDDERRMVSVILVGSPKLCRRLEDLDDGEKTVDLAISLPPLGDRDVDRLIRHRLTVAGQSEGNLFSPVALAEVARRSRGNPMRINALCEAAMALAEREMNSTVSRDLVERAASAVEFADDDDASHAGGRQEPAFSPVGRHREAGAATPAAETAPAALHGGETVRRLDDVAEAIRAADLRSVGGGDPHIKYAFSSKPLGQDEPKAAYDRERKSAVDERFDAEPPAPFVDDHRFYPGSRPSEPYRPRRRGWLATTAVLGLILASIVAGGLYASRNGLLDVDTLADQVETLATKAMHFVSAAIRPDPVVEEGIAGGSAGTGSAEIAEASGRQSGQPSGQPSGQQADPVAGSRSTTLAFDRFGSARNAAEGAEADKAPPVEAYEFTPPPPQAPRQAEASGSPHRSEPTSQSTQSPGPGDRAQQPPPGSGPAPASSAEASGRGGNDNLLDPGTAAILSRVGPREMAKPTPPPPPERPGSGGAITATPSPPVAVPPAAVPPAAVPPAAVPPVAAPPPAVATTQRTAPASEQPPPAARNGRTETRQAQSEPLLARGDEYLVTADLDMARTFYQMAYERGSAEAAVRMGWTFDPQYYQRVGLRGEASPREAILWYQEAARRGARQASERLSALATWLQSAAASGDVEAQRILRLWQG